MQQVLLLRCFMRLTLTFTSAEGCSRRESEASAGCLLLRLQTKDPSA